MKNESHNIQELYYSTNQKKKKKKRFSIQRYYLSRAINLKDNQGIWNEPDAMRVASPETGV